jgi:hypothetical protein
MQEGRIMITKTYTTDFSGLMNLTLIIEYAGEMIPEVIEKLDIVERTDRFFDWATEFSKAHENFDWDKYPYLEEIEKFIRTKE